MNNKEKQDFIEGLSFDIDKTAEIKTRRNVYIYISFPSKQIDNIEKYIADGWEIDKEFKTKIKLRKKKQINKRLHNT